jgi:2-polyprenyl-3-methyl-5-hydroxy-6-metoxy-1,4-benzoquinol methylase
LGWIPIGTHSWHAFITPSELKNTCFQVGCIGWVEQGYGYLPIRTPAWNFSRSKDTNFFFATRKR